MPAYLTWALNDNGDLVHIDTVPNGIGCGCYCPHCKSDLCAKNGGDADLRVHHFSHLTGADCKGAVESAIHKMAKDVLLKAKCVRLPYKDDKSEGEQLTFDRVDVEYHDPKTNLRPDCVGHYGENVLWIEFKRSHAVDSKKKGKIISAHVDCIEIDLYGLPLDPEIVKEFITESSEQRKWIRDTKRKRNSNGKSTSDRGYGEKIDRWFAKDENGNLVNLQNDLEVDMNDHSYYCLACDKELTIDVDDDGVYTFTHIDEDVFCEDDLYKHEAAKEILRFKFYNSEKFEIAVPQNQVCENKGNCDFYDEFCCVSRKEFMYNLKEHGYTDCMKEFKFPNLKYKCDIVFMRNGNLSDAIVVSIKAGDCHIDATNISNRTIEINVYDEESLNALLDMPVGMKNSYFLNFKENNNVLASKSEIDRLVTRFSLYSSGKHFIDKVRCGLDEEKRYPTVIEYLFVKGADNYVDAKRYALMKCFEQKRKACLCEICYFIAYNSNSYGQNEAICKRYKTKGTPRNPLNATPINCPYFSLDNSIKDWFKLNSDFIVVKEV